MRAKKIFEEDEMRWIKPSDKAKLHGQFEKAIKNQSIFKIKNCIINGIDITIKNDWALYYSIVHGNNKILKLLLYEYKNENYHLPRGLITSCLQSYYTDDETLNLLIDFGANVSENCNPNLKFIIGDHRKLSQLTILLNDEEFKNCLNKESRDLIQDAGYNKFLYESKYETKDLSKLR